MILKNELLKIALANIVLCTLISCSDSNSESVTESSGSFPFTMPSEKPDIPMSAATERMFSYSAPRPQDNELFSQFKYTRLKGFSIMARFDCDLSLDYNEPLYKKTGVWHKPEVYFQQGLGQLNKNPEGR